MKQFLQALLLSFFVSTHVNSILTTTKPLTTQPSKCNVNNNNYNSFFSGPNCKKIETMFSELKQHVTELKEGLKEIKGILNGNKPGGKGLSQLLFEIPLIFSVWYYMYGSFIWHCLSAVAYLIHAMF